MVPRRIGDEGLPATISSHTTEGGRETSVGSRAHSERVLLSHQEVGFKFFISMPDHVDSPMIRYNGALMLKIAYGHPVASAEDEYMAFADRSVAALTDIGSVASTLVDFVPICKSSAQYDLVLECKVIRHYSEVHPNMDARRRLQASSPAC